MLQANGVDMGAVPLSDPLRAAGLVLPEPKPLQRHSVEPALRPQVDCLVSADLLDFRRHGNDAQLEVRR